MIVFYLLPYKMDLRSVGGDVRAEYVVTFFQIFTSVNYRLQILVLVLRFQGDRILSIR